MRKEAPGRRGRVGSGQGRRSKAGGERELVGRRGEALVDATRASEYHEGREAERNGAKPTLRERRVRLSALSTQIALRPRSPPHCLMIHDRSSKDICVAPLLLVVPGSAMRLTS